MARRTKYNIVEILDSNGPLLAGELTKIIIANQNARKIATKKAIERAFNNRKIKRVEFMSFGRGERLYYSYNISRPELLQKILKIIESRRPIIHRLIVALKDQRVLPHRHGLKLTGLPTQRRGNKESYHDVIGYLRELGIARNERILMDGRNLGFLVLNTKPIITQREVFLFADRVISEEKKIRQYLATVPILRGGKNMKIMTQVGNRIFDAVGEAFSRKYMIIIYDFNLMRRIEDYDIAGLLDRVYSVYRKKFKQTVITYCVSHEFTKAAQRKAMTGRFKQINLIQLEIKDGIVVTKRIQGVSKQSRGELFENQIRYILQNSGFHDVQRGLKIYLRGDKLTEQSTAKAFTDIDIITQSEEENKVIICELKNWHVELSQVLIEEWVQNKLNKVVDYLVQELHIKKDIEAWFIVSRRPKRFDETTIQSKASCRIRVLSKLDFINDIISKKDRNLANELRPIVLD